MSEGWVLTSVWRQDSCPPGNGMPSMRGCQLPRRLDVRITFPTAHTLTAYVPVLGPAGIGRAEGRGVEPGWSRAERKAPTAISATTMTALIQGGVSVRTTEQQR